MAEEALKAQTEQYLRQLGDRRRAGEFGNPKEKGTESMTVAGQVAERDFLAGLPGEIEGWLEGWVWVAVGKGKKKKLTRTLAFLGGAQILGIAENQSKLSRAEAIVRRRQAKQKRKPDFNSAWLKPSRS